MNGFDIGFLFYMSVCILGILVIFGVGILVEKFKRPSTETENHNHEIEDDETRDLTV